MPMPSTLHFLARPSAHALAVYLAVRVFGRAQRIMVEQEAVRAIHSPLKFGHMPPGSGGLHSSFLLNPCLLLYEVARFRVPLWGGTPPTSVGYWLQP
jgi:hypothetical protein